MSVAEATPEFEAPPHDRAFLGHPKGLGYLAFVEGCERFSYYSMQTLLVLYMTNYLLDPGRMGGVFGLEWLQANWYDGREGQPLASKIFGDYSSTVYLTPIIGGYIADRWLGRRAALIAGGIIMAIGHFLMASEGAFLFALLALVVGVGLFKGNIATQVGELYSENDVRRAMAFQIFYIAINGSVIIAPLISGTLAEKIGWHYGFGTAGVVMVIGFLLYLKAGPWLPPDNRPSKAAASVPKPRLGRADLGRLVALIALVPVLAVALLTNQEIFNAYIVWGDQQFQLTFMGFTAPTSWLISADAFISLGGLLTVAAFYVWYGKRFKEPDELGKMIIGSLFTTAGGLCLVMAAATQGDGKIGLFWPLLFHVFNSIGFAHILPVSLALFTKVAPKGIASTVVGIYYLAFFSANKIVGEVGGWYSTMETTEFWLLHVATAAVGLVGFVAFRLVMKRFLAEPAAA